MATGAREWQWSRPGRCRQERKTQIGSPPIVSDACDHDIRRTGTDCLKMSLPLIPSELIAVGLGNTAGPQEPCGVCESGSRHECNVPTPAEGPLAVRTCEKGRFLDGGEGAPRSSKTGCRVRSTVSCRMTQPAISAGRSSQAAFGPAKKRPLAKCWMTPRRVISRDSLVVCSPIAIMLIEEKRVSILRQQQRRRPEP